MARDSSPRIVSRFDRQNAEANFLTIDQVATKVSVSSRSVRRWVQTGALAVHRIGRTVRIAPPDLSAFLARCRQG